MGQVKVLTLRAYHFAMEIEILGRLEAAERKRFVEPRAFSLSRKGCVR